MPKSSWPTPPDFRTHPEEFNNFLLELFNHLYGLGGDIAGQLDTNNVQSAATATTATSAATVTDANVADAVTKRHDPGTNHKVMMQATDPANAASSSVSVTSADATDLATVITLANELKADVNQLVTDLNAVVTKLNALLANMRTGAQIA